MKNNQLYVIVQAGGRGSRLRHHTWNKPKCLVSINGKPILYYLFDRFPEANFIIIGDYLFDVLEKYLSVNKPNIKYTLILSKENGTASGIADALSLVPANAPTLITWSDLIFYNLPTWPESDIPIICTTSSFTCRWSLSNDCRLEEVATDQNGIPGLFYFPQAQLCPRPPANGEFVRWLSKNILEFNILKCPDIAELGDFSRIEQYNDREGFSRFFNKVEISADCVTKTVIDNEYAGIHANEVAWYREASRLGFRRIPKIYAESPLKMQRVIGLHPYQMTDLNNREKSALLADYLDALISLHEVKKVEANDSDVNEVYIEKTIKRVQSVSNIIPGFERSSITINGLKCQNPFAVESKNPIYDLVASIQPSYFAPIHGDPTFSNTIIDDKLRAWFIDPRGYFANPGIMGDVWYDFAKVYYSAIGGYDGFNRRKFKLHVDSATIEILYQEPAFSKLAKPIFKEYFNENIPRIEIIHALIWLALSGYAKDDVDSVIGSFYLGLYWLELATQK
jgi:GTP:adenosylcobinamide-phosphate guanylyltransferase